MSTTQDYFIETDQGRLYARRWHAADTGLPPLVLLHDSLGCVALWRDFPQRLAEATGREVIAYDRLGFGRSDPHPGRLTLDFVSREAGEGLRRVREQLGIGAFVAMGHSVGGGMAIAAASSPDCRGLITESAQVFAEERTLSGIRQAREDFAQPGQLDRLKKYHGEKAAWVLNAGWTTGWRRISRLGTSMPSWAGSAAPSWPCTATPMNMARWPMSNASPAWPAAASMCSRPAAMCRTANSPRRCWR